MSIKHRISKAVGFRPRRGRGGYALRLIAAVALAAGAFSATPANAQVDANALAPAVHTVACGGGVSVRMVTPNAGFDPQTASDAQLDANALPPRPTNAAALAVWKRFIAMPDDPTPRCPVNSATSPARSAPLAPISTRPSKAVSAASEVNSTHWSGNIADDQSYTDAFGTWDVPFSGPRPASDPAYSSSWVGVGQGDSAEQPLMQAGTESDNTGEASYYLWWELYPENDQKFIGYVEPGDSIYVHAHLSYGDDYAIAEDLTSGLGKGQNFYLSETSIWPDNTAEWIFERTELVVDQLP